MKNIQINLHFLQTGPPRYIFNSELHYLHYLHTRSENLYEKFGKHVDNVDNAP